MRAVHGIFLRTTTSALQHPRIGALRSARALCIDVSTQKKNALLLLGLQPGASPKEIKFRYYDLAKRTHPDVIAREAREAAERAANNQQAKVQSFASGVLEEDHASAAAKPTVVPFLEVQAAYDILMQEDGAFDAAKSSRTARAGARPARERTLGEVLCDRLKDEPAVYPELWEEIVRDKMRVTEPMVDALFRAARRSAKPGEAEDAARAAWGMIFDGTYHGVLTIDTRCSALISLLAWCEDDEAELGDLAVQIVDYISDEDRAHSPAIMAAIGAVFCRGTRSPY